MSNAHNPSATNEETPLAKAMNQILLLGVPAFLLVMLGLTAYFFIIGMGDTEEERAEAAAKIAAARGVPAASADEGSAATAAAGGGAPAPAAAGGLPEGVTEDLWAKGRGAYATCLACHGPDGQGLQAGPAKMAPSLVGSQMLLEDADATILVILKGIQKESMDYLGMMAALGAGLNDEQIAGVITYTRNSWGNSAPAVTPEQVAEARAKFAGVNAPAGVKRADIPAIVSGEQ